MSTYIEMPQEMQNRIKSKARMTWGYMPRTGNETADEMYLKSREHYVAMYEKLSAEKYFQRERDNKALAEIMRENERLLRKIQDLQAPRGGG